MVVLSIHIKKYPDSKHHLAIVFETKDSAPFLADYVRTVSNYYGISCAKYECELIKNRGTTVYTNSTTACQLNLFKPRYNA